jgi:membrane protease YdiL (CAAX protease family)
MWNDKSKKPIWSFLVLTFLIDWVFEGVLIFIELTGVLSGILSGITGFIIVTMYRGIAVACAPAWAMLILLKKHNQIKGFKDFFLRIFKTEKRLRTVIITVAFFLVHFIVYVFSGKYLGDTWYFALVSLPWLVAGIIGGGMEEVGWRGFLQPALEEKLPFVIATLCTGVIWAVWHIPTWFVQSISMSSVNFLSFALHCITLSFVMAALYKLTKSVFACVLFHSWSNALGNIFSSDLLLIPPDFKLIVICTLQIITAIIICVFVDKKRKGLVL